MTPRWWWFTAAVWCMRVILLGMLMVQAGWLASLTALAASSAIVAVIWRLSETPTPPH